MENLAALRQQLSVRRRILLVTHTAPDGDAIGSLLALYHLLVNHGHSVRMVTPTDSPAYFDFLPKFEYIQVFKRQRETALRYLSNAEAIFILDLNDYARLDEEWGNAIAEKKCFKALIDHHLYPKIIADFSISDTTASSTAQLIHDFAIALFGAPSITPDVALCIYTGIATDTGRFKFNATAHTLSVVSHLLEKGLQLEWANNCLFDVNTEKRLRLLGYALTQRMTVLPQYKTAYIELSNRELLDHNYETGDLEGVVNYPLSIAGIKMAVLFREHDNNLVRISFRSKGGFSVNDLAAQYFEGGGHKNAAGGSSYRTLGETIAFFKGTILPKYADELAV